MGLEMGASGDCEFDGAQDSRLYWFPSIIGIPASLSIVFFSIEWVEMGPICVDVVEREREGGGSQHFDQLVLILLNNKGRCLTRTSQFVHTNSNLAWYIVKEGPCHPSTDPLMICIDS